MPYDARDIALRHLCCSADLRMAENCFCLGMNEVLLGIVTGLITF
jgi:hypothetical protein